MSASGLSKERLDRLHDRLVGSVDHGMPNLVAAISRRGEVHVDAIGTARDTIYRISSMTKPVTAAATMILVEEGRLGLDEPIDELLPELGNRRVISSLDAPLDDTVPAKRSINVRDLLTFRCGHGGVFERPEHSPVLDALDELKLSMGPPAPAYRPDPDEWVRRLGTVPLLDQPGEQWRYHTGADILGVLIARASGQPFETFLRERLFEPLGMKDTGFSVPPNQVDRFGAVYFVDPVTGEAGVYDDSVGGQWNQPPAFLSGGDGLVSTVDDYLTFGQMLLNDGLHGRERVLSRPAVETMRTDQLTAEQKARAAFVPGIFDTRGWGFGMAVVTRRTASYETVGRFGWDGGLGTSFWADPRENMVSVLMTSRAWTAPVAPRVCRDFWAGAYAAIDD
jgi:CubicO group peptidase (beta-lactamase class C family)